ncbi:hypothetical protein L596_028006 [Steinernema carpocapsae]|uniref:Uncharacterized protein n=1 Tax=Steinernema carpocapsae TaxID=34508 RepID=A0A4U5LX70_STECR|nr:hypothetical protein L596_028006 [Steinernema carpocapsae]
MHSYPTKSIVNSFEISLHVHRSSRLIPSRCRHLLACLYWPFCNRKSDYFYFWNVSGGLEKLRRVTSSAGTKTTKNSPLRNPPSAFLDTLDWVRKRPRRIDYDKDKRGLKTYVNRVPLL